MLMVDLYIPDADSLKSKRSILKRLKDRIRDKFNVSVSEIGMQDIWRRSKIGIVHLSNDGRRVDSELQKVVKFLEKDFGASLIDYEIRSL